MGLFDEISKTLSGNTGSIDYAAIIKWVEQQGGISALLAKLRQGGLAEIVESWIGTNQNLPITSSQIQQAFGQDDIAQLANKLGVDQHKATAIIAQFLPQIINKLSPDGKEPQNNDFVSLGLGLLKDRLFK